MANPNGNIQNLVLNSDRTPEERRENARKAGIRSGQVRRERADMRKAAQRIINNTYTTKGGQTVTGDEVILDKVLKVALDTEHRSWSKAVDILINLTTEEKNTVKDKLVEMQIKLLQAKIDALTASSSDKHEGKLSDLIEGLIHTNDLHEETAAIDADVASTETEKNKHSRR